MSFHVFSRRAHDPPLRRASSPGFESKNLLHNTLIKNSPDGFVFVFIS